MLSFIALCILVLIAAPLVIGACIVAVPMVLAFLLGVQGARHRLRQQAERHDQERQAVREQRRVRRVRPKLDPQVVAQRDDERRLLKVGAHVDLSAVGPDERGTLKRLRQLRSFGRPT